MISLNYSHRLDKMICKHEKAMLREYTQLIEEHKPSCQSFGCTIKTGLMWKRHPSDSKSFFRERIQNGYECYVYCSIEKNGETVLINSNDGEADFYPLSTAWMITSIRRSWFNLKVQLFQDIDNDCIDIELNKLILLLSQSCRTGDGSLRGN